jgi:hypothetical protein
VTHATAPLSYATEVASLVPGVLVSLCWSQVRVILRSPRPLLELNFLPSVFDLQSNIVYAEHDW